ncbi:MAG: hypothetical protein AB1715_01620 [Acidobacteriota bacterium]
MENSRLSSAEIARLRHREAELRERIEKLKQRMNETKEISTLTFKAQLFKKAQEELRMIQEKLAGRGPEENSD